MWRSGDALLNYFKQSISVLSLGIVSYLSEFVIYSITVKTKCL